MADTEIELAKLIVSSVALIGTIVAAVIAVRSFRRTEQWKRAEFLAREMKEFFADRRVQNALLMIDWGSRQIPLLDESSKNKGKVKVTRELQVRALLPHTLVDEDAGSDVEQLSEETEAAMRKYTAAQAAIRDCYDAFLDGLERFSSYVQTGLVDAPELRPYLGYWIDDIHAATTDSDDAAWAATLLTYITFYRFNGVTWLFQNLDRDINCTSSAYSGFLHNMTDQTLAARFARSVNVPYEAQSKHTANQ